MVDKGAPALEIWAKDAFAQGRNFAVHDPHVDLVGETQRLGLALGAGPVDTLAARPPIEAYGGIRSENPGAPGRSRSSSISARIVGGGAVCDGRPSGGSARRPGEIAGEERRHRTVAYSQPLPVDMEQRRGGDRQPLRPRHRDIRDAAWKIVRQSRR
jgi:hypothetical protein